MRAPHWQNARKGRRALNEVRDRFGETVRIAKDVGADSADYEANVYRGFRLPGAPHPAPIELCEYDEEVC
jgi:hypothetical protein